MSNAKVDRTRKLFAKKVEEGGGELQAAFVLGLSKEFIHLLSIGKRNPGLEMAFRIKEVYGIPMEDWVEPQSTETVKRFA